MQVLVLVCWWTTFGLQFSQFGCDHVAHWLCVEGGWICTIFVRTDFLFQNDLSDISPQYRSLRIPTPFEKKSTVNLVFTYHHLLCQGCFQL